MWATATTRCPPARTVADRLSTSAVVGGVSVRKPRAEYQPTSRSPARHEATTRLVAPTRVVTTRRTAGWPGGKTAAAPVGVRCPPPPLAGTQPTCGLNVGAGAPTPTYEPTNATERAVVIPGLTGLPDTPRNARSMARSLSSASSPATMNPRGQVSWNWTCWRGVVWATGTTTHGPATGTQGLRPRHSLVAPAVGAAASTATTAAPPMRRRANLMRPS